MDTFIQDLRYALRRLTRRPTFTAIAMLTLGLGIGANTTVFGIVDALLYRPLPVPDTEGLVSIVGIREDFPYPLQLSYPEYLDYRELPVFDDAVAFTANRCQLSSEGAAPERVFLEFTSPNYFSTLGATAATGRVYQPGEVERGEAITSIVLGHRFWQRRFRGDATIVGQTVRLNDTPFTVAGVADPEFRGTAGLLLVDAWVPATAEDLLYPEGRGRLEDRSGIAYGVIARLRPGVTLDEARAAVDVRAKHLAREFPDTNVGRGAQVYPEPSTRMETAAAAYLPRVAGIFMTLVGLVLLVACANVANLLLAHAAGRQKELAVRAALGSSRLRVARQLVTESVVLALGGGALGLGLAWWGTRTLASLRIASDIPFEFDLRLSPNVFLFALLAALLTGVVAGLAPALQAARGNLHEALKEGGRGSGSGARGRVRNALVVAQVAVSLVLMVAAGLFLRSLQHFDSMDLGFQTEDRLILSMDTALRGYDEARSRVFYAALLDRVRALPGVHSATVSATVPIDVRGWGERVLAEHEAGSAGEGRLSLGNVIATDYFRTTGSQLVAGRAFEATDTAESPPVVIVNEELARRLWPGQDPLSRRLRVGDNESPWAEVVGVARQGKYNLPGEPDQIFFYVPTTQRYQAMQVLEVHAQGQPPTSLVTPIRREIAALDPDMPIFDVRTMETHIREGKGAFLYSLASGLVGAFGILGLVLACVGLYGVMAYTVSQRVHELGIRMALGASGGRILTLVLGQGLALAAGGLLLGLAVAYVLTQSFGNLLVGVTARDPLTFAAVSLLLVALALFSAWWPARRATRVDPLIALRAE